MQLRKALVALATVSLGVSATSLVALTPAYASGSGGITVDPSVQYQTIQGWGTSLAWWAEGVGGWSAANRQALDSSIFGLTPGGKGLGLNIVRYDIGATTPGDQCSANMRVGAAAPSFDSIAGSGSTGGGAGTAPGPNPVGNGNYNWNADPNQMNVLQDAQSEGANVFAGVSYSAPASMTNNNCSGGAASSSTDNLASANNQNYADYLSAVIRHFHDSVGIPLSSVDPVNEPVQSAWNNADCVAVPTYPDTKCQQGMYVDTSQQGTLLTDLANDLNSSSYNGPANYTQLSAPDEQQANGAVTDYNAYSSAQQANVAQLNSHDYGDWAGQTDSGTPLYLLGQQANKPIWMSEWGSGGGAVSLSQEILKNENEMHPAAWVAWQAVDGPFNGETGWTQRQQSYNGAGGSSDLWGLVNADYSPASNQTASYPMRYYVMGNYSEFVRPGYRMIRNTDPNTFTAWDQGSNKLVIVATNTSDSSATNSYDLSRFGLSGATVAAYQTAPAEAANNNTEEDLKSISPTSFSGGTLTDSTPPGSVTTYVVSGASYSGAGSSVEVDDATTGTGNDQWDYTGSTWGSCAGSSCGDPQNLYGGTTHWDWSAGDTATMSFTGGRVRLFGVTDTSEGRATVSVDGGPATELDFYSASRHGNQLMWESPQLYGSGSHTLSVKILGTHNPQSSGALVALDRAEVDPLTPVTVDDATIGSGNNQWTYTGSGWTRCANTTCADPADMYARTASWDANPGDTAKLTFTGTSVTLYGITDTNEGVANVSIDGGASSAIDFYSPSRQTNVPVFAQAGLANTSHTLTVTITNQKDAQSSENLPVIDRAVVNSLVPATSTPITSVDDTTTAGSNRWTYGGSWSSCSGASCGDPQDLYSGTTHWNATANATASLTVSATASSGSTIDLYGVTDTNEGQANVSVDGGSPQLVDFYSSTRQGNHLLWHADNLAAGSHTVTVTVLGTKNASSTGTLIALDRANLSATPFFRTVTKGTARNDFTGKVGMRFTTGATAMTVTGLGRMWVGGNTATHPLAIYNATTHALVAGASVNTAVANTDASGFQYAMLPQPVVLAPNTTYDVVSQEWSGSDKWYDVNTTATLNGSGSFIPVYSTTTIDVPNQTVTTNWTPYASNPDQTYGPVSLLGG